jgi:chemotaxis response regulator CheB
MQALAAGAVSIISRPKFGLKGFLEDATNDIIAAIRAPPRRPASAARQPDSRRHPATGRRARGADRENDATAPTPSSPPVAAR